MDPARFPISYPANSTCPHDSPAAAQDVSVLVSAGQWADGVHRDWSSILGSARDFGRISCQCTSCSMDLGCGSDLGYARRVFIRLRGHHVVPFHLIGYARRCSFNQDLTCRLAVSR